MTQEAPVDFYGIDVTRQEAVALQRIIFDLQKQYLGCVVRSLESYFGAAATDGEWQQRINDVCIKLTELYEAEKKIDSPLKKARLRRRLLFQDWDDVDQFMEDISGTDTALGNAMKGVGLKHQAVSGAELLVILSHGEDLLATWRYMEKEGPDKGLVGHMAHLRNHPMRNMAFSVSDQERTKIKPTATYYTIRKRPENLDSR